MFMAPELYTSPAVYEIEMRRVWPDTWVLVADIDDLGAPGDFVSTQIGYEPIVVVRDSHALRAFSNVCPHRASLLVEGAGNCGRKFQCPYHGWSFGLDGRLLGAPYQSGFARPLNRDELGLHEVSVDAWERFVFVNVTGVAPPLQEFLGDLPARLDGHDIGGLTRMGSCTHHVEANWKVFVDNGTCDYHVPVVHARLMPMIKPVPTWVEDTTQRYVSVLEVPLSDEGLNSSSPYHRLDRKAAEVTYAVGLYPNALLIAFRTGDVHVISWWPESVSRTEVRVDAYVHGTRPADDLRYGMQAVERLQLEDIRVCELVQRGLHSGRYRPGPTHQLEARVLAFQREYLSALERAAGVPLEELTGDIMRRPESSSA
jgi:phenylpropionate dioxygenase-like ring-hydroxylating dioxygenase large terminal subunit